MKMALLYMDKNIFSNPRWDAKLLITYHDEVQLEVREDQAEAVGKLIVRCFEQAGTFFKLNCPITGEFAIGKSWAETH
jgi:DNA polymerase-1